MTLHRVWKTLMILVHLLRGFDFKDKFGPFFYVMDNIFPKFLYFVDNLFPILAIPKISG